MRPEPRPVTRSIELQQTVIAPWKSWHASCLPKVYLWVSSRGHEARLGLLTFRHLRSRAPMAATARGFGSGSMHATGRGGAMLQKLHTSFTWAPWKKSEGVKFGSRQTRGTSALRPTPSPLHPQNDTALTRGALAVASAQHEREIHGQLRAKARGFATHKHGAPHLGCARQDLPFLAAHPEGGGIGLVPGRGVTRVGSFLGGASATVIRASDTWGIWTVLLMAAAGGFWSENFEWGRALSGPLVSTLFGLAASNGGLIPTDAPAYALVNRFLLPLAVPLLLFGADLRRVVKDTGRLLVAFCLGAAATVVGTFVAFALVPMRGLGSDSWKIAAALMSRHIGGAVNYVAVAEAFSASPSVVAAGLAADNLLCAVYFSTLFALAAGIPPDEQEQPSGQPGASPDNLPEVSSKGGFNTASASLAVAISAAICWLGSRLAQRLRFTGGTIPCATAITVALATLFPTQVAPLVPSAECLASLLLQVFFAAVGAAGSVSQVANKAPSLFLFSFLQISVHLALILGVGRLMKFDLKELLLASNANVGGPTTGAGMAAAKGWKSLLVPTILVGVFGYATATFLSIFVGHTYLRLR